MEKNKMYTFTRDESGKITDISVNGKPVKRGSMRGFKKAQTTSYWKLFENRSIAKNPFSGVTVELDALEATIYAFCVNWYSRYDRACYAGADITTIAEVPVQCYDDMKYFLLELNPDAYMDLID